MKLGLVKNSCIIIGLACSFLFAKDMILSTPDGLNIVLHDDSTWVFQNGQRNDLEKDFTVPVSNGKIVLISASGTWGFVNSEIKDERELVPSDSVTGKGHAANRDIAVATAQAQKQAFDQVVARMKIALKNMKIDQTKLSDCVRRVEKNIDKNDNFKKDIGWEVSVSMKLDRGSIFAVAECAEKKAKPVDTTAKAAKKK
jgi:hypothetical protein